MLRTHQTLALCGFLGFALFIAGCGAGGVASKPAAVRSGEAAKTTAADSSIAPQRYAEAKGDEAAMMKMMRRMETTAAPTAEPKAEMPAGNGYAVPASALPGAGMPPGGTHPLQDHPTEGIGPGEAGDKFAYTQENDFLNVKDTPLSTFSIDVDTASYSKTRAYLLQHHSLP
ncbi:MAG: von Willebrand factor type A domain-containing protein, partial [Planctomycetales bacterium]|nr:von Willebrand factor type A domain-containing protein [Planctomycetales bacterium]